MHLRYCALLFCMLSCLACQDKREALRQKRLADMEARIEKELEKSNQIALRALERKVIKEGNSPEGLTAVKMARKVRQKTKKCTNIATHEQYIQTQLQPLMSAKEWKEKKREMQAIPNPKIRILYWERYFLRKIGADDISSDIICFVGSPLLAVQSADTLREGEHLAIKLFCDSQKRDYWVESIWVNGILNKDKHGDFTLPKLRAGKQTVDLKIKYLHKYLPEKDTMIFYTHHFHVLPRQQ